MNFLRKEGGTLNWIIVGFRTVVAIFGNMFKGAFTDGNYVGSKAVRDVIFEKYYKSRYRQFWKIGIDLLR